MIDMPSMQIVTDHIQIKSQRNKTKSPNAIDSSTMLKKTEAKRTEIDWNLFVHQPDALVSNDYAEATKQNLKHIERNFRKLVDLSSHLYFPGHLQIMPGLSKNWTHLMPNNGSRISH